MATTMRSFKLTNALRETARYHVHRPPKRFIVRASATWHDKDVKTTTTQADAKRHIILAVDDSQDSEFACEWAVKHLLRDGDKFHLMQCVPAAKTHSLFAEAEGEMMATRTLDADDLDTDSIRAVFADAARGIRSRFASKLRDAGVQHDLDLVSESADDMRLPFKNAIGAVICDKASDMNADAIVLASDSAGGLAEWFFGSVTSYCVHNCKQPVLVLHNPGPQHAEAAAQREQHGRHIIVAVDDSDAAFDACCWAADHLYREGDVLHLMRVLNTTHAVVPALSSGGYDAPYFQPKYEEDLQDLELLAQQQISQRFHDLMAEKEVKHSVDVVSDSYDEPSMTIGEALCRKANELNAAAVVMAAHHKGFLSQMFLGSVTDYCAHHCASPVVVLH